MGTLLKILLHAAMITGFVFIMMVVIEYIHVTTKGLWQFKIAKNKWGQYLLAGILGAIPGCLGAFTIVTMFSHRMVSFGALVTAMIATSGDEAFVMFSMFPAQAALITVIIFIVGMLGGYLTDKFYKPKSILDQLGTHKFSLHETEHCQCFEKGQIWKHFTHPGIYRLTVAVLIIVMILGVSTGAFANKLEIWMKVSVLLAFLFSLFIVLTVPDHFLDGHIWEHIVKQHLPRIFVWVMGTLIIMHFIMNYFDIEDWITGNLLVVMLVAVLVGFIPESGPHLVFVTLFAQGTIPLSILLASSISQDGHAGLPLLAESRKAFVTVKIINIIFALVIGTMGYLIGF